MHVKQRDTITLASVDSPLPPPNVGCIKKEHLNVFLLLLVKQEEKRKEEKKALDELGSTWGTFSNGFLLNPCGNSLTFSTLERDELIAGLLEPFIILLCQQGAH